MSRPTYDEAIAIAMRSGDIDTIRKMERERMAIMREASRKEAFTQGYIAARADAVGQPMAEIDDFVILGWLPEADAAYVAFRAKRSPA